MVKKPPVNAEDARDVGLIPELGRSPGVGNGNLLHYSYLENSLEPGRLQFMGSQSWTQLKHTHTHTHTHTHNLKSSN